MKPKKKKGKVFLKIIAGSSFLFILFFMAIIIGVLMILSFFGAKLTVSTLNENYDYAESYKESLNKYFKNGYVPLSRMLYFYLENDALKFDTIYSLNQDTTNKDVKDIYLVCEEKQFKNMTACDESNINDNMEFLEKTDKLFNFPLDSTSYTIPSFYNEERYVYEEYNIHHGWDFTISAQTPIYSVCNGTVTNVNFTQEENIPYDQSNNKTGNYMTIACNDYFETYYVTYHHLYPNSAKVNEGDLVDHWTEIASVGTTGWSTGNHLHYAVTDVNNNFVDGMLLVDMTLKKPIIIESD